MLDPFDPELHREAIDAFKESRLCDPYKRHAYDTITRELCVRYWIEQVADAELYAQRWRELGAACDECPGHGGDHLPDCSRAASDGS